MIRRFAHRAAAAAIGCVALATTGCGPADPALGECAERAEGKVTIGTGATEYEPIGPDGVLMDYGPQGGHHIWVGLRCESLGPTLTVRFGIRRTGTQETLTPVGLETTAELEYVNGAEETGGLRGYLNDSLDLQALVDEKITIWASITDDCGRAPVASEIDTVISGFVP